MNAKALQKQLIAAVAMLLVAAIALGSSTYAWFVNNNTVQAKLGSVNAATASASLYINTGTSATGKLTSAGSITTATTLTPVSVNIADKTKALSEDDWYIVGGWTDGTIAGSAAPVADSYIKLSTATVANGGHAFDTATGGFTYDNVASHAYLMKQFTLFTNVGSQDVYLDAGAGNVLPIQITSGDEDLSKAVRIAVVATSSVASSKPTIIYYLPYAEAGTGNSSGATANAVQMITGVDTSSIANVVGTDSKLTATYDGTAGTTLSDGLKNAYCAVKNTSGTYTKADDATVSLGTVTGTGTAPTNTLDVKIYIWLDGTDANCTDASVFANELSTQITFAGVTPTT